MQPTTNPNITKPKSQLLTIYYVFGSYPVKGFEQSEIKIENGLLGGNFAIGLNGYFFTFVNATTMGLWDKQPDDRIEIFGTQRYLSISIPCTISQYLTLLMIFKDHNDRAIRNNRSTVNETIAFFNTKRIIAFYRALSDIAILPRIPKWLICLRFNHARKLRRYLMRKAFLNGWKIDFTEGRETRIWETV
jgi:hypothetical protein